MVEYFKRTLVLPTYKMIDKHERARLEELCIQRGLGLRGLIRYCNRKEEYGGLGRHIGTIAAIRKGEDKGLRDRIKALSSREVMELRR